MTGLAEWANHAYGLAEAAGQRILAFYQQETPLVPEYKADQSPLTIADQAAHAIINAGLSQYLLEGNQVPIVSEEGDIVPFKERQSCMYYWCVDPLDGTKDFLARNNEFTVNIALIRDHQPVIGVIYVPAQQLGYIAWQGGGAYRCKNGSREKIATHRPPAKPLRVLVSRQYTMDQVQPWLSKLGETNIMQQGSALKFCRLASGEADLFVRLSPTSEWDNAAGHCILEEAGGSIFTFNADPLRYNCSGTLEQGKFIAVGADSSTWKRLFIR